MNSLSTLYHLITLNGSVLIFLTIGLRNIWITKLNIIPTMEEISLHGKEFRKLQQHESFTFKARCVCVCVCVCGGGGGVECKVESRSLKLFIPDNT